MNSFELRIKKCKTPLGLIRFYCGDHRSGKVDTFLNGKACGYYGTAGTTFELETFKNKAKDRFRREDLKATGWSM